MDLIEATGESIHRHPWEIARASSILKIIKKYESGSIADIGAGDLYFARKACEIRKGNLVACDIHFTETNAIRHLGIRKVSTTDAIQDQTFDLVFLLDVLEHIENEESFLQEIRRILRNNGRIIITVPAFQFLFGQHDLALKHFRRYSRERLNKVFERSGFVAEESYYFYSSLFLLRMLAKTISLFGIEKRYSHAVSNWGYPVDHFITRLLVQLLNIDFAVNMCFYKFFKRSLPGLSICAIVKKRA